MSAPNVATKEPHVVCALCNASNDSDSRFCKQCGKSLPRSAVTLAQVEQQIETLVKQALDLYDQNRLDEALLTCEGVLTLDHENVSALSLKGLIHEKKGQMPLAIEAFEEVVRLNPMSVADKAKLESLKRNEHTPNLKQSARPRSVWLDIAPTVLAITAGGALMLFGLWLSMRMLTLPVENTKQEEPSLSNNQSQAFQPPSQPPANMTTQPPALPAESDENTANETATNNNSASGAPLPPMTIDPSQLTLSPRPNPPSSGNRAISGPIPSQPRLPGSTSSSNPMTTPSKENEKEDEAIVMPDVGKQPDTGVYDIQVTRPSGGGTRGSGGNANANNVDGVLRTAQNHQAAGNYQQAIALYQQSVPNLKHPGEILQRIALCYYRLNDKVSARNNYQQAIQALNQQIQAGVDSARAREILQTCQQGLALCEEY